MDSEIDAAADRLWRASSEARPCAPVLWGRNNPFDEVSGAETMHEVVAGSRLELRDDCGHWPQHEKAEEYNEVALDVLRGHRG